MCNLQALTHYKLDHIKVRKKAGFTLVELLVVIGIITLLIGTLLPSITRAKQYAQKIKCAAQLREIGSGVQMYLTAYKGVLNATTLGARWLTTTGTIQLIDTQVANKSYWGVAYAPFLLPGPTLKQTGSAAPAITSAAYGIWHCPSSLLGYPSDSAVTAESPVSYGINGILTGRLGQKWRHVSRYKDAANTVFAQDAIKPELSAQSQDTLSSFGQANNLTDWRPGGIWFPFIQSAGLREYYRHMGTSNVLWLDGHVSSIAQSDGTDIPQVWYQPRGSEN